MRPRSGRVALQRREARGDSSQFLERVRTERLDADMAAPASRCPFTRASAGASLAEDLAHPPRAVIPEPRPPARPSRSVAFPALCDVAQSRAVYAAQDESAASP
jgi:hypothetical protein